MKIQAVLCDIEGTTSSISFVHKVLFPLSLEKIDRYLSENAANPELRVELDALWQRISHPAGEAARSEVIRETLRRFIREDVKDTTLKWIQGKIWKVAFEQGSVKGHVYPDVPEYFKKWKGSGIMLYIYSSGSVEAQKLMFRYSEAGDLSARLDGYYDTQTGMKRDSKSYEKITRAIDVEPAGVLFLSDIVQELAAAEATGLKTCLLLREEATTPEGYGGPVARDFSEVHARFF